MTDHSAPGVGGTTSVGPGVLVCLLGNALMRVAREIARGDTDARGLMKDRNPLAAVDVYMHPETLMHFLRDARPFDIDLDARYRDKGKGPPGAYAKFMNVWLIADPEQPQGGFIIRNKGEVFEAVPLPSPPKDAP